MTNDFPVTATVEPQSSSGQVASADDNLACGQRIDTRGRAPKKKEASYGRQEKRPVLDRSNSFVNDDDDADPDVANLATSAPKTSCSSCKQVPTAQDQQEAKWYTLGFMSGLTLGVIVGVTVVPILTWYLRPQSETTIVNQAGEAFGVSIIGAIGTAGTFLLRYFLGSSIEFALVVKQPVFFKISKSKNGKFNMTF